MLLLTIPVFPATSLNPRPGAGSRAVALELYHSFSGEQLQQYFRPFEDERRMTWERLPKTREGIKIADLSEVQKNLFHRFLQASLSSEGYLMVTAVMFNEDIQQRFEPYLGKNEYYIELFGMPEEGKYWGWQLEGHHLSVNLTFHGDELISHTPFLLPTRRSSIQTGSGTASAWFTWKSNLPGNWPNPLKGRRRIWGIQTGNGHPRYMARRIRQALKAPGKGFPLSTWRRHRRKNSLRSQRRICGISTILQAGKTAC